MKKTMVCAAAATVLVTAGGCYRDFDFNYDAKAEHTYIAANGDWLDAGTGTVVFDGQPGDIPVPHDWDGDHNWDKAVLRNGEWVTGTPLGTISFPAPAQLAEFDTPDPYDYHVLPVAGDYDGDGSADPAWYRDTDGTWFIEGVGTIVFGSGPEVSPFGGWTTDQDFPVPADYDGDGITDLATFNAVSREWKVLRSVDGTVSTVVMDGNEIRPIPAPGDYDGVGHAQRATLGSDGWAIEGRPGFEAFGTGEAYLPAVADYDGDGRVELSYTSYEGSWNTDEPVTGYAVFDPTDPYTSYSVVTGHNLVVNAGRLNLNGRCDLFVQFCG